MFSDHKLICFVLQKCIYKSKYFYINMQNKQEVPQSEKKIELKIHTAVNDHRQNRTSENL